METPAAQSKTPPPMIFQDLLLELMLQNEALAKIESVNLKTLEVLKSSAATLDDISTKSDKTSAAEITDRNLQPIDSNRDVETGQVNAIEPKVEIELDPEIVCEPQITLDPQIIVEPAQITLDPQIIVEPAQITLEAPQAQPAPRASAEPAQVSVTPEISIETVSGESTAELNPNIIVELDASDIRQLVPSDRENTREEDTVPSNTTSEDVKQESSRASSPNYGEELVSLALEQVRVLEFILKEVKNTNSRTASVSDAIQQLTGAVIDGLEMTGSERLSAEEARRESSKKDELDLEMPDKPAKKEEGGLFGKIMMGLGILGSLVAGFVSGIIESVTGVFSSISKFFSKNFPKLFTTIKTFFTGLGARISAFFGESKIFGAIKEFFTGEGSIFAKISGFFGKIGTLISEAWAAVKGKFPILSKLGSIGNLLGKLAVPITAIIGVFDGLKAGFDEYEKSGDLGKAFGEGTKGLVTSLIGAPLDLVKSLVSWLAGLFGFEGVESFLDSFSFSDIISVFLQRVIDWGRGIFEKLFLTIYDVFSDIGDGFSKGPLEGILEILRGLLKTIIAMPLDMVKNTIASLAGLVGASGVEEYLRGISFTEMLGGSHTKTIAEEKTTGKSVFEEAGDMTAAKKLAEESKKVDEHIAEQDRSLLQQEKKDGDEAFKKKKEEAEQKKGILESIQNPITVFYDALIKAYQENNSGVGSGVGPQTLQAVPSTIGAEISAMESDTADLEMEAQSSGPATVVAPQSRTVNNSNQSVTYNSNNIPDRTTWLTTPLASWLGV